MSAETATPESTITVLLYPARFAIRSTRAIESSAPKKASTKRAPTAKGKKRAASRAKSPAPALTPMMLGEASAL